MGCPAGGDGPAALQAEGREGREHLQEFFTATLEGRNARGQTLTCTRAPLKPRPHYFWSAADGTDFGFGPAGSGPASGSLGFGCGFGFGGIGRTGG